MPRLVRIRLAALTRVEYTEVIEVPADINKIELEKLVADRYNNVDGGLYFDDPDFWEKGTCFADDAEAHDEAPTLRVERGPDGKLAAPAPMEAG